MALTTKPRWDKFDGYVGNFRGPLAADVDLATEANVVLAVGVNSDGAVTLGAGQTGIVGVVIIPVGHDMHGNLLDGGVNIEAGDIVDVGKHGEITNFQPNPASAYYSAAITANSGNVTYKVNNVATANVAYNANAVTIKAALVAVDDGFSASDFDVTGTAPDFVITPSAGIVVTAGTGMTVTAHAASTTPAAGTVYYGHADGTVTSTAGSDGVYVGHTVEATRLIVDVNNVPSVGTAIAASLVVEADFEDRIAALEGA